MYTSLQYMQYTTVPCYVLHCFNAKMSDRRYGLTMKGAFGDVMASS